MKITGYEVDWKDDFRGEVIEVLLREVGGAQARYEYDVSMHVDAKLLIIASETLTREQLYAVWEAGDLGVADKVFDGTFDEILARLRENLAENE